MKFKTNLLITVAVFMIGDYSASALPAKTKLSSTTDGSGNLIVSASKTVQAVDSGTGIVTTTTTNSTLTYAGTPDPVTPAAPVATTATEVKKVSEPTGGGNFTTEVTTTITTNGIPATPTTQTTNEVPVIIVTAPVNTVPVTGGAYVSQP